MKYCLIAGIAKYVKQQMFLKLKMLFKTTKVIENNK
jgi:hypothetical protein